MCNERRYAIRLYIYCNTYIFMMPIYSTLFFHMDKHGLTQKTSDKICFFSHDFKHYSDLLKVTERVRITHSMKIHYV